MRSWQKVCLAQSSDDLSCHEEDSFQSPLKYLSSFGNSFDINELEDTSQQSIFDSFDTILNSQDAWAHFSQLFTDISIEDQDRHKVKYMQTILKFGTPLEFDGYHYKGFTDPYDNP